MFFKNIRVLVVALSLVACFAAFSHADVTATGYVSYVWMNPNGSGDFVVQFSNISINGVSYTQLYNIPIGVNTTTNKSILAMILSAQATNTIMCFSFATSTYNRTTDQYTTSNMTALRLH